MFRASGNYVNSSGVDTAVTENICKLGNILFNAVKYTSKKVTEIVRKNFIGIYICRLAEFLHISPNVCTAEGLACSCDKDTARFNFLFFCIFQKFSLQSLYDKNTSTFSFAENSGFTFSDCLNSDKLKFTYTDTCSANRLQNHVQSLTTLNFRSRNKAEIFLFCQLFFFGTEYLFLFLNIFYLQNFITTESKKTVK